MLKIKLKSHTGYAGASLLKLTESIELLQEIINTEEFKKKVLNFKSDKTEGGTFHFISYTKWRGRRIDLKRYSNQEVLDIVMKGNSRDGVNQFIEFDLTLEPGNGGSTVGYTDYDGNIHTYDGDFQEMSVGDFAAHLFHEYTHTIDFEHSQSNRNDKLRDCYSVPYALGNIVEIIATGTCIYGCTYK